MILIKLNQLQLTSIEKHLSQGAFFFLVEFFLS